VLVETFDEVLVRGEVTYPGEVEVTRVRRARVAEGGR
jgi:hypothetical protein